MSDTAHAPASDERIKETSALRKALIRPELGGIVGTIDRVRSFRSLPSTAACSLPKAFSTGRRLGPVHDHRRRRLFADDRGRVRPLRRLDDRLCRHDDRHLLGHAGLAGLAGIILITFALCLAIGALNGFIVVRTGLPSFIVTLAFLFILRGFTIYSAAADRAQDHHRRHRRRRPKATGWRRSLRRQDPHRTVRLARRRR
jgi:simple sugar transport system permease protein